ncbi:MAG: protease-4 [Saprospiraceae bacterium]|jgi:protease-4
MTQFLKFIFASCLGTILAFGLVIVFFAVFAAASSESSDVPPSEGILHLRLDHVVPELTDNVQQQSFDFESTKSIGVNDIVRLIRKAKTDENIKGILLRTEVPQLRPATAQYIADVLQEFRDGSDKFVDAYGNYFTQAGYVIACSADSIRLNPNGLVDMRGYGMTIPYFKDFSERTGIEFDIYHAGKFKSAVEPYYLTKSSEANRLQTKKYLQAYHNQLAATVADQRDISVERADEIITKGLAQNAGDALDLGLVDKLEYYEDYEERLQSLLGTKKLNLIEIGTYLNSNPKRTPSSKNKIAVIYAEGEVAGGGDNRGDINMSTFEEVFEKIEKDDKYKAIVLRVNSPGGSAFTSDIFLQRIKDLQAQGKYVVASFGDYAASGGYYIAASADEIVSEPTTLTGSIGVFSMIPSMNEFFDKHVGIDWDTIGTGNLTFLYSSMINRTAGDNAILQSETERTYHLFKSIVAEGRNMTIEEVDAIGQGRVWSGADAIDIGLVDQLGTIDDAIALAAEKASYGDDYKVMNFPVIKKTFWEEMLEGMAQTTNIKFGGPSALESKLSMDILKIAQEIESACNEPQARIPFHIPVE